ncbi:hypothetical protein Plhal304r1_c023g0079721 [Plasmopara halstedii]
MFVSALTCAVALHDCRWIIQGLQLKSSFYKTRVFPNSYQAVRYRNDWPNTHRLPAAA